MAQTGYTPIQIYSSSTGGAAPSAGNLTNSTLGSELAINITDGKLFYKDNAGVVQVIAWKTTPTTAGGTGLTSYTAGDLLYYASGTALTKLAIGASTTIMTSSGTAPQWSSASGITVGKATNLDGGAAGSVPYQSGAGATTFLGIGAANTVLTSSGSAPQWSTALTLSGNVTAAAFIPSSATVPSNGLFLPAANTVGMAAGSAEIMRWAAGYAALRSGAALYVYNATNDGLGLWYNPGGAGVNKLVAKVNGADRLDIDGTAGDVTVSTGNLVIGTSGKGIDFSATAGSGTSELFDDYEEGTFTPTYETTGGSFSYSSQLGRYTKIGRVVYCTFTISTSSATVGSGDVVIGGLPFTIENSGNARGGFGLGRSNGFSGDAPLGIIVFENANFVYLTFKATVNGDTAYLDASDLNTGSGNQVFGSFYYTTPS